MATKAKSAEVIEKVPAVQVDETVKTEEPRNEWDQLVKVRVPRRSKNEFFYVCVNDRRFEIPANGLEQEMPLPVAEILQQSIDAENKAQDYAEGIPNKTGFQG